MITESNIREWMKRDELWRFYKSKEWITLKTQILKAHHYECTECRKRGIITRHDIDEQGRKRLLSTVHHVCHVRDHPELAMSRFYKNYASGQMEENLIPVCKACHNKLHPEKRKQKRTEGFTNEERW